MAVISNILKGKIHAGMEDVVYLQPELDFDETDLHNMSAEQFSNWALVRQTCMEKKKLSDFFSIDEERFIVVHIDTAEAEEINYEVQRPAKHNNPEYSEILRNNVIEKIKEWLENQFGGQIFFAIAIEETEAWVLTIYADRQGDTCRFNDPKKELNRVLNRKLSKKEKRILGYKEFEKFNELSKKFRKLKHLEKYADYNESLKLFCESLEEAER